jgi:phosphoglycerol transferase MdoB-like AlkP superfamily enzyme
MAVFMVLIISLIFSLVLGVWAYTWHSWICAVTSFICLAVCWKYRRILTVVPDWLGVSIVTIGIISFLGALFAIAHLLGAA